MTPTAPRGRRLGLPEEVYDKLQRLIPEIVQTRDYIQRCINCGIKLDQECADCDEQLEVAQKIKAEFFPDRP